MIQAESIGSSLTFCISGRGVVARPARLLRLRLGALERLGIGFTEPSSPVGEASGSFHSMVTVAGSAPASMAALTFPPVQKSTIAQNPSWVTGFVVQWIPASMAAWSSGVVANDDSAASWMAQAKFSLCGMTIAMTCPTATAISLRGRSPH